MSYAIIGPPSRGGPFSSHRADIMLGVIKLVLGTTLFADALVLVFLLKERSSPVRTVFALYIGGIASWTGCILLNIWFTNEFIADLVYASAVVFLTAQVWFAKLFPEDVLPRKLLSYWSIVLGGTFFTSSFIPGALFSSITFSHGYVVVHNGWLAQWYSLFVIFFSAYPIVLFVRKRLRTSDRILRTQFAYLTVGFSIFLVLTVLANSVLPVFFSIYIFNVAGPICSLALAAAIFYITWRYNFLDIPSAVQRGAIYSFLFALVIAGYWSVLLFVHEVLAVRSADAALVSAGAVTIVGVFTIPLIERYFKKRTDVIFFKDRFDYATALETLGHILHTSTELTDLISRTQESLRTLFRAESASVTLFSDGPQREIGADSAEDVVAGTMLAEPIVADGSEIGRIMIGKRLSGDRYGDEDRTLLRTFALQAATALARAQLLVQVQQYAHELETKVEERTYELREAQENERQIMLDIAHGLQTPLTVFRTKLNALHSENRRIEFDATERSFEQLTGLVADLLMLANVEYAEHFDLRPCSFSELVEGICEEMAVIADAQGVTSRCEIEPDVFVLADTRALRIAIINLASNAIKYMRRAGERSIEFRLTREDHGAVLAVRDNGIGILPQDLPHIFDRFYRVDRSSPGSGLGLAISKRIIEGHGGTLTAQSTQGVGTTMTVVLPLCDVRA